MAQYAHRAGETDAGSPDSRVTVSPARSGLGAAVTAGTDRRIEIGRRERRPRRPRTNVPGSLSSPSSPFLEI